ncbi:hypothetical protein [Rhodospirillum centenum]|uniref:Uncharacterized protein n=1 Tax=Rhodospirillum centenum (strain ATCC 51521 / SW) TaxID=414684 RepID=B6IWA1_RHOCS|nr:hypothetical protein [Rhodospirillum centenum]ACJ00575.1 conserved hypothetical protein [Rhodospirillum centenum SW]
MAVMITDREVFAALSHVDARAYLLARGWREEERIGNKAAVLVPDGADAPEILLPLREDLGDYALRLADAVRVVAAVEGRAETSVLTDFRMAGTDVIRVRAGEAAADGTLSFQAGIAVHELAREVLLSAACAAHAPRALYGNRKPQSALDYLETVRLGQSERGSYVVTLLSPVDPALGGGQPRLGPEFEDDPFARIVTRTLLRALRATRDAVTEAAASEDFAAFERRVRHGVSANLCEALAKLVGVGGTVELGLTWAKVRPPRPDDAKGPLKLDFGRSAAGLLQEAARQFRVREPLPDQELSGWVVRLMRRPARDALGSVLVRVMIDGRPRSIRIEGLSDSDYAFVAAAHADRKAISFEGDLHRRDRAQEVRNARNFAIVEGAEDEEAPPADTAAGV